MIMRSTIQAHSNYKGKSIKPFWNDVQPNDTLICELDISRRYDHDLTVTNARTNERISVGQREIRIYLKKIDHVFLQ